MNRYTLITGASRGIGKAIALNFATKGINLILVSSKSNEALAETMQEVLSYGVCCMAFSTDVSDYSQILDLKSKLADSDITIDCVVNNAGIDYFGIIQDMSVNDWHHIIDVNLSSIFYTSKAFIPDMLGLDRGCIINISSVFGSNGGSCEVAYSASKGGINGFTRALAKELAPSHISVNAIACGAIDTSMNDRLSNEEKESLEDEIPVGRMGKTTEVADLAYSLYSMNEYLTGQIITIDGGWF